MPEYSVYYPYYSKIDECITVVADSEDEALQKAYEEVKYAGAVELDPEELFILETSEE